MALPDGRVGQPELGSLLLCLYHKSVKKRCPPASPASPVAKGGCPRDRGQGADGVVKAPPIDRGTSHHLPLPRGSARFLWTSPLIWFRPARRLVLQWTSSGFTTLTATLPSSTPQPAMGDMRGRCARSDGDEDEGKHNLELTPTTDAGSVKHATKASKLGSPIRLEPGTANCGRTCRIPHCTNLLGLVDAATHAVP